MARCLPIVVLVLLASGCGGRRAPDCVSSCGWELHFANTCDTFEQVQDVVLEAFAHVPGWSSDYVCHNLEGWGVEIKHTPNPDGSYHDPYDNSLVNGLAFCDVQVSQVGWGSATTWGSSAAAHELMHAMDRCATPNHEGWDYLGYWAAIQEAQNKFP